MSRYSIIRVSPAGCREEIIAVMQRNLSHQAADAIFPWRYERSPFGSAECWVARDGPRGPAVGLAALFPRVFHVEGRPSTVWVAGDFSVDREHRGYGPALMLQKGILSDVARKTDCAWIYGVPNDKSRALFVKLGYRPIGYFRKFVKILKADYVFRKLNVNPNILLKRVVDGIGILSREYLYRRQKGISVEAPDGFDARFDALWMAVRHQYPIIGERTAAFLTWRYSEASGKKYRIFGLTKDGKLAGYIVYQVIDGLCQVADLLAIRDQRIIESLISEFALRMRAECAEAISIRYFGSGFLDNCIKKYNFFRRGKDDDQIMIYNAGRDDRGSMLENAENWYFLDGDGD